ncbi:MAG: ABC transporter permease subunit [Phycisphaerae bacterium]
MTRDVLTLALRGFGLILFIASVVWPSIALVVRSVEQGLSPTDGFALSSNQLGLLWRSVWLSGGATLMCVVVALPGACVMGRMGRLSRRPGVTAAVIACLLCPPMVYAFGWEQVLAALHRPIPTGLNELRCIVVWALWAWPIPAIIIGAGWNRVGRCAFDAAILVASRPAAVCRVVLPLLSGYVALAALVLFALFMGEYGVPHACGLSVYATDLLGRASSSSRVMDTAWASLPPGVVTGATLLAVYMVWRRCDPGGDVTCPAHDASGASRVVTVLVGAVVVVAFFVPIAALLGHVRSLRTCLGAAPMYGRDIAWSLGTAALAGAAGIAVGVGLPRLRSLRRVAVAWAVLFGTLPGALIGVALVAAYNRPLTGSVYDHWPIVTLCYVSRFAWIGLLATVLATRTTSADLIAQARADGAGPTAVLGRVELPLHVPVLVAAAGVIGARSLADVATSTLVRVPDFNPIAHVIIEKFHRFEDDVLISLSLLVAGAGLGATMLVVHAIRSRRRPR